jgi:hypothetical protein
MSNELKVVAWRWRRLSTGAQGVYWEDPARFLSIVPATDYEWAALTDIAAAQERIEALAAALDRAMDNLRDHGENCFLHSEGEYDACFCGKNSLVDHLQSVLEGRAPRHEPEGRTAMKNPPAKIVIQFKDPGAIYEITNARHPMPEDEDDITPRMEKDRAAFDDAHFEDGDYGQIEIDPLTMTARILPRKEWK